MTEIQFKDCLKHVHEAIPLKKERLFIHEIMFIKFTLFAFHACFPKNLFLWSMSSLACFSRDYKFPFENFQFFSSIFELFGLLCQTEKENHEQSHDCQLVDEKTELDEVKICTCFSACS
jgi:hypothetical protein